MLNLAYNMCIVPFMFLYLTVMTDPLYCSTDVTLCYPGLGEVSGF